MIAVLLLLACGRTDPTLAAQADALAAWRAGAQALDDGDLDTARARFAEARAARPNDALLVAWEARVVAAQGDPERAVSLLADAIARAPGLAEARYNRAAYLARLGRWEEAGPELQRALADGAATPREAAADPDFAAGLSRPELAFLPAAAVDVSLDVTSEGVFWGSLVPVTLDVRGGAGGIALSGALRGPVELVSAWEDRLGPDQVRFTWTVRVIGAGELLLGPISVDVGTTHAEAAARTVVAGAPPGKEPRQPPGPIALETPSAIAEALPLPGAAWDGGVLRVSTQPADRVELDPPGGREVRIEVREGGQPRQVVHELHERPPGPVHVRVIRKGASVLDVQLPATAP